MQKSLTLVIDLHIITVQGKTLVRKQVLPLPLKRFAWSRKYYVEVVSNGYCSSNTWIGESWKKSITLKISPRN